MKALSIKQPWSWLIVNGHKDVENRDWPVLLRGEVFIHAGKVLDDMAIYESGSGLRLFSDFKQLLRDNLGIEARQAFEKGPFLKEMGGIVGIAEIVSCVTASNSPWFFGKYGFVLRNARPLPFTPLRGQLGFFDVPQEITDKLLAKAS